MIGTGGPQYMQQASPRHRYTSFEYDHEGNSTKHVFRTLIIGEIK